MIASLVAWGGVTLADLATGYDVAMVLDAYDCLTWRLAVEAAPPK